MLKQKEKLKNQIIFDDSNSHAEILWTGGLPHQSGLPHLPGVPHPHVNRPLDNLNTRNSIKKDSNSSFVEKI